MKYPFNYSKNIKCIFNNRQLIPSEPKRIKTKKEIMKSSLKYVLRKRNPPQSVLIRMGNLLENVIKTLVHTHTALQSLSSEMKFDDVCHILDWIGIDEVQKKIFVSEFKSNINLDTEKTLSVCKKLKKCKEILENTYPNFQVECIVVNLTKTRTSDIIPSLRSKFEKNGVNIYGVNHFFRTIGCEKMFRNEQELHMFIDDICRFNFVW